MRSEAKTPDEYIASLPDDRREAMSELRNVINSNIPKGFEEAMGYGMMGWEVPHSIYPAGYHCDPKQPLPFMGIASQKNNFAVYHMGIYRDEKLLEWFVNEWPKHSAKKLDMGKSCIRIKKAEDIPFELVGQLAKKMTPKQWIALYEQDLKR
jgi:uncharacterized protein YdhG (YjbR/CyaY superfamily)